MEKVIINSYEEFEKLVGQQIGVSDYVELSQERINLFADATLDHQWIHVDTERAKVDSPYHSTIAHGYLTLSMLPYLWNQIIQVNNLKMMINYGMDKMKFGQAVSNQLVSVQIRCRKLCDRHCFTGVPFHHGAAVCTVCHCAHRKHDDHGKKQKQHCKFCPKAKDPFFHNLLTS